MSSLEQELAALRKAVESNSNRLDRVEELIGATARVQAMTAANNTEAFKAIEGSLTQLLAAIESTRAIADSNARSIQALSE